MAMSVEEEKRKRDFFVVVITQFTHHVNYLYKRKENSEVNLNQSKIGSKYIKS